MDSAPVNWEALDALLLDFAKSERLIHDSPPPSSPPSSSSYRYRILICQIRRSIESGDIESAIDLLRAYAPAVLDDHRILFRLQKQKFIELLRKGTSVDRLTAIKCARTSLAPCALDAYPEAYEEFKHALLAFIYDKDDQMSPVVYEWSERRRFEIAGLLSSILRAHLQAYDPIFTMTLRYLISIHKGFCLHEGISSPIANLTERLLLDERDPPATPQESLFEAPLFDEVDIQALAHAVELTRQGAIDSLRFAKGDLHKAFQNDGGARPQVHRAGRQEIIRPVQPQIPHPDDVCWPLRSYAAELIPTEIVSVSGSHLVLLQRVLECFAASDAEEFHSEESLLSKTLLRISGLNWIVGPLHLQKQQSLATDP